MVILTTVIDVLNAMLQWLISYAGDRDDTDNERNDKLDDIADALGDLAEAIEDIEFSPTVTVNVSGGGCGCGNVGTQLPPGDTEEDWEDNGFPDQPAYLDYKCQAAHRLYQSYRGVLNALAAHDVDELAAIGVSAAAALIGAAISAKIAIWLGVAATAAFGPIVILGILASIILALLANTAIDLQDMLVAWDDAKDELICIMMEANSTAGLEDDLLGALQNLTAWELDLMGLIITNNELARLFDGSLSELETLDVDCNNCLAYGVLPIIVDETCKMSVGWGQAYPGEYLMIAYPLPGYAKRKPDKSACGEGWNSGALSTIEEGEMGTMGSLVPGYQNNALAAYLQVPEGMATLSFVISRASGFSPELKFKYYDSVTGDLFGIASFYAESYNGGAGGAKMIDLPIDDVPEHRGMILSIENGTGGSFIWFIGGGWWNP